MREDMLGEGIQLGKALDTWSYQARGSSARVFEGFVVPLTRRTGYIAVKVMRPDEREYAAPLFKKEVKILAVLQDVPGVMRMLEMGFVYPDSHSLRALSQEQDETDGRHFRGRVYRYSVEEVEDFLADFDAHIQQGALPYIGVRIVSAGDNLWRHCDWFLNKGRYLPVATGLEIAYHAIGTLAQAHQRGVTYIDHKIVHYYWHQKRAVPVTIIDWNVGEYHPEGVPADEVRRDVTSFAVNTLYYILTGEKHSQGLNIGPSRKDEIERTLRGGRIDWKRVHRPLDTVVKDLLARALGGEHSSAEELQADIHAVWQRVRSDG